jgi:hypothetical protein
LKSIRLAFKSLTQRGIRVKLRWLFDYIGIPGNEIADKYADTTARMISLYEEPSIRYLSAVKRLIKERLLIR